MGSALGGVRKAVEAISFQFVDRFNMLLSWDTAQSWAQKRRVRLRKRQELTSGKITRKVTYETVIVKCFNGVEGQRVSSKAATQGCGSLKQGVALEQ